MSLTVGRRTMCPVRKKANQEVIFDFIPDRRGPKMQVLLTEWLIPSGAPGKKHRG